MMNRSSRRSREREDDHSSDNSTRLRSRRRRGSTAESPSDTDSQREDSAPQRRQRRRSSARRATEDARHMRSQDRHSSRSEDEEEQEEEDTDGRKRSLSNVSNTSTTSAASSLASEKLTEEQRRARLEQQVEELEQKKRMVEDGTLAEFCRRVAAFKEERNRLLQTAELHKNLQLKNGQDLYGFEVQRAQHLWQHGKEVLKTELLGKADAVMAKLQEEMKALSQLGAKVSDLTKRAQPKETKKAENPVVQVSVVKIAEESKMEVEEGEVAEPVKVKTSRVVKRRKMEQVTDATELSDLLPAEAVRLPFDDVSADIAAIVNGRKETTKSSIHRLPNAGNLPFKLEQRKLHCGQYVFEDGDEVAIESPLVQENYTGTISSITDDAIYIKLPSDQKVRIFLPHLERQRCAIKPLVRGTTTTGTLRNLGWTEYEEF